MSFEKNFMEELDAVEGGTFYALNIGNLVPIDLHAFGEKAKVNETMITEIGEKFTWFIKEKSSLFTPLRNRNRFIYEEDTHINFERAEKGFSIHFNLNGDNIDIQKVDNVTGFLSNLRFYVVTKKQESKKRELKEISEVQKK